MNSTHTQLTRTQHQSLENCSGFKGMLTKLLHEAFYLEDDFIHTDSQHSSDFIVAEPEEDHDQLSFIHQFLKLRT